MMTPAKTIRGASTLAKIGDTLVAPAREAEGAEADPFDDATIASVAGMGEALKAEVVALKEIEKRLGKLAQRL